MVLPLGHGPRHNHGLRISHARGHGVRLLRHRECVEPPTDRPPLGLSRICTRRRRHDRGNCPGRARAGLGALHLLPATDRQSVILHRCCPGGRRLVGLGRADVDQHVSVEARQPGRPSSLSNVRDGRRLLPVGLDRGRCGARIALSDHPGGARLAQHDRRRTGARLLLLDIACYRLFLADAGLHRLLHDRAAGDWRPAVQRHDGPDRLHPVPHRRNADRHPPRVRGSASRLGFQISALGVYGTRHVADLADRVHDLRIRRDRRAPARWQRGSGLAEGAAVAQPRHARGRPLFCHARFRRRRRADQHELSAQRHGPQYPIDYRPFSPDLRRRDRHHVFRDRLRHLATSDGTCTGQLRAHARSAMDVVRWHDRADIPVALGRHSRHAPTDGVLRLHRPGDRRASYMGDNVGRRWRDPGALWRAVLRRAGARADGAADRASALPLQRRGTPAARVAGCAQRLRAVAGPDGCPDHCELRLSDCAFPGNAGHGGTGRQGRRAVVTRGNIVSLRNPWFTASVGITAAIALVAAVVGFIWLPLQHPGERFKGIWDAICSAAGLVRNAPSGAQIVRADYLTTSVEIDPQMLQGASAESIGRGATLALRCTMCHGARGLSQADTPNLAGQYPVTIYKELVDFKTGARASAVMAPLVVDLTDADMHDLAAYYAYLPRVTNSGPAAGVPPRIVASGAPLRSIAPCGACHGEVDSKASAAWLEGQPAIYLRTQLAAFATGARHNDIGEQMRNIARRMTPQEIDTAGRYYADRP